MLYEMAVRRYPACTPMSEACVGTLDKLTTTAWKCSVAWETALRWLETFVEAPR